MLRPDTVDFGDFSASCQDQALKSMNNPCAVHGEHHSFTVVGRDGKEEDLILHVYMVVGENINDKIKVAFDQIFGGHERYKTDGSDN